MKGRIRNKKLKNDYEEADCTKANSEKPDCIEVNSGKSNCTKANLDKENRSNESINEENIDEDSLHFIFRQLMRLHHYRANMLLNSLGVHPGQPSVLFMLEHNDGMSQKEIAEKLKLKSATVTVMLKRMEKNELLYRKTDAMDLRISRVYLTEAGRDKIKKIKERFKSLDNECFHGFSREERMKLRCFLTHMRDNLVGVLGREANVDNVDNNNNNNNCNNKRQ